MISSRTILNEIAADNLSGASAIYLKAIDFFRATADEIDNHYVDNGSMIMRNAAKELVSAQPAMAPLYNLASSVIECVDSADGTDDPLPHLERMLNALADEESHAVADAAERAARLIDAESVILTISYSSAVRELIIRHPFVKSLKVIVPESRPMCEGARLADALGEAGVSVVLISDLSFGSYIDDIDFFVCGADAVTEKYLVNKVGTAVLSRAVKEAGGTTITIFSENKVITSDVYKFSPGLHPAGELAALSNANCSVENRYFEQVPLENFSKFVTNRNIYVSETMKEHIGARHFSSGGE